MSENIPQLGKAIGELPSWLLPPPSEKTLQLSQSLLIGHYKKELSPQWSFRVGFVFKSKVGSDVSAFKLAKPLKSIHPFNCIDEVFYRADCLEHQDLLWLYTQGIIL